MAPSLKKFLWEGWIFAKIGGKKLDPKVQKKSQIFYKLKMCDKVLFTISTRLNKNEVHSSCR